MDDALLLGMVDGVANLAGVIQGAGQIQGAFALDDRLERLARHVLHHDEEHIVLFLGGQDGDDVRMVEGGEEARFAQQLAEVHVLAMRNFDRDSLVDPRVFRQIDGAEATAPECRDDAVLSYRLAAEEH